MAKQHLSVPSVVLMRINALMEYQDTQLKNRKNTPDGIEIKKFVVTVINILP